MTTEAGKYIAGLLKANPDAPSKTLARVAFEKKPELFGTFQRAYGIVRYYNGTKGNANRAKKSSQKIHREPQLKITKYPSVAASIPDSWCDTGWGPVEIDSDDRIAVLCDVHIPYHDKTAVEVAIRDIRKYNPSIVLLGGDVTDNYKESRWEQDPTMRPFTDEVFVARKFLEAIRSWFPKARIIYKEGNHEERHAKLLMSGAPALYGFEETTLQSLYHLDKFGIEWVGDKRPLRLGKLNFIHGHEYGFFGDPSSVSKGFYRRAKTHVMGGHYHRTSQNSEPTLDGTVLSQWSVGCLCGIRPKWKPLNDWNHGFATVETAKGGEFRVQNYRIIHGKAY